MNPYITLMLEKGPSWFINRSLYSLKLKGLNFLPQAEVLFEKKVPTVQQLDIFEFDVNALSRTLHSLSLEDKKKIIEYADMACQGKINAFSSIILDYGFPIQWQLNPITGKYCDNKKKWYQIPDFDSQRGDIKVVWEISRFTHFFQLAKAYLLTDNKKYADAYFSQIADWVDKNPYSFGANYKCGQECAFRMISCLLTYPCFLGCASAEDVENIKSVVHGSYKKILSNFFYAYRCIKNNHTISELVGMIIGAWCCKDTKRGKYAKRVLNEVICEQFSKEGGYTQQSFNYQRLAVMDIEIILSLERKTGISISEDAKKRVLNSVLQIFQCQDEGGDVPNYGSNDGALILPLATDNYRDFRQGINAVHTILTGSALYDNPYLTIELIWLNCLSNLKSEVPLRENVDYPHTGLSVFRNGNSWMMVVCKQRMHHMDNGHVDLWINGKNILCDAGSYSYASDLGKELYTNKAHNTAWCEDTPQIRRVGAFAVYGQPTIKERNWSNDGIEFDIQYKTGYEHRRKIRVLPDGYEIQDSIVANNLQKCFIQFHVLGEVEQLDCYTIKLDGCIVKCGTPMQLHKSKRSLYYLRCEEITCISIPCENSICTKITID